MAVGDASELPDPPSTWAKGALLVTRRPDIPVSPDGHPGPEQRRELIGARRWRDPSQHIRPFSATTRVEVTVTSKGAWDVRTIGAERPNTEVALIVGVDTHLDFHVAVGVDHLGRRLWASRAYQRP